LKEEISVSVISLGRLSNVEIRKIFASEAGDFTPWLASEENLKLLSDTVGIGLQLEATEKDVGLFRADILCKDVETDNWVLIENQIERTDHIHLGQLLTYAAGLEAVTISWVAQKFTEEHRAALDWLNAKTQEVINFFGLEIELWRIGDSPAAPKFNVVSRPNEWGRSIKAGTGHVSDYKVKQLKFWTAFKIFMDENTSIKCGNPSAHHYMHFTVGLTGAYISASMSLWDFLTEAEKPEHRVQIVFNGSKAKQRFAVLEAQKQIIESELGFNLIWFNPADNQRTRILTLHEADFENEENWPGQFQWFRERLELFYKVFTPILKTIDKTETNTESAVV
jgi:hypothetical protein